MAWITSEQRLPAGDIAKAYGFTPEHIADIATSLLREHVNER
jgi:hypothetical protein